MSCKFKQIVNLDKSKHIHESVFVANDTIADLINRVAAHMLDKKAQQKSKTFLKNKIISLEMDSVKQVYQNRPLVPNNLVEEFSPRHGVGQCLRPMSAQVRHETVKHNSRNFVNQSKRTIMSYSSFGSVLRSRPNTASTTNNIQKQYNKRRYQQRPFSCNQKKFFAIKTNYNNEYSFDQQIIEQLRTRKFQQQEQIKKKQQFLRSIQFENKNFTQTQAKFTQTIGRKKFIYGQQGEIIEINKNMGSGSHLKKISAVAKSRVQVKQRSGNQIKRMQQELKENIYIEFKGRQGFETRPQTATINDNNNKQPTININIKPQQEKLPSTIQKLNPTTKQQLKTNNFLTINTIRGSKPIQKLQQKSQTSLKNITKSLSSNVNLKSPQQTKTQLDILDEDLLAQQKKKKQEKIFFYPSVNSVYRVIDDFHAHHDNGGLNEDSFN